jgi:hypothetical protein
MRRPIVFGSVVALALTLPTIGLAVMRTQPQGGAHVNCTASASLGDPRTTTSTTFSKIAPLELNVESVFGMSESVTLVMSGSPVNVKVVDTFAGGSFRLDPGVATIHRTADDDTASITFVTTGAPATRGHTLDVEWRLAAPGGTATIRRSAVNLVYQAGDSGCPFI